MADGDDVQWKDRRVRYERKFCRLIKEHLVTGMSLASFAGHPEVQVSKQTVYNWLKRHPEFYRAAEKAMPSALYRWEQIVLLTAVGKMPGNTAMILANMRNRFKWEKDDTPPVDDLPEVRDVNSVYDNMTPEELTRRIQALPPGGIDGAEEVPQRTYEAEFQREDGDNDNDPSGEL